MSSTTIRSHASRPAAPARPDGTPYRYEMAHSGGARRTYADEPAELVAALIPGYADLADPVELAGARIRHAVSAQAAAQAALNVELGSARCAPEEREVLTADRDTPPIVSEWTAPVPLVLVDCFYAPVTDVPRPTAAAPGRILWLHPATDLDYLHSLAALGVIMLAERTDPAGERDA